jgi:phosphoglycerate dehydrogenase-like enzyme
MDKINVMVVSVIDEEYLCQIDAVSPRIKVLNAANIWNLPDMITDKHAADCTRPEYEAMLARAEVIYGYRLPPNVIARAPRLKWIQGMLAGAEHIITDEIVQSRVILTNMRGIHSSPVSEVALEMMLLLAKQAPLCFQAKQEKKWQRFVPVLFRSQTVGVVGLGHIGKEIARLSKAFGARVLAADISFKKKTSARNVDVAFPIGQLASLLAESDFVVLSLPFTPETNKIIGEKQLKTMKPTAYLVNVGRGPTVDEEALIRALEEGWIAGAGLDVFTTEPLPVDHKLWELPNVFFSPHISGRMLNYNEVATKLFCENLRRYVDGKKLLNVVNKKKGF